MRHDKEEIILARKEGLSYLQISQKFGVPKSTLSLWLKDVELSLVAQKKLDARVNNTSIKALIRRNKEQTQLAKDRHQKILLESKKSFLKFKKEPLFLTGVALYWGEGYKKGAHGSAWKAVDLANSDSKMVKVFIRFLKKYLSVTNADISVQLIIAPNQNISSAINFWSKTTGIGENRFMKTYSKVSPSSKGIRNKESLPFGTVHIRINSVDKFFTLIGWIECLKAI